MQKKDVYLICMTMIICSIIIGLIVGSFILHGLEDIAAIINHGLLTINQSIYPLIDKSYSFLHFMDQTDRSNPVCFLLQDCDSLHFYNKTLKVLLIFVLNYKIESIKE